MWGSETPRSRMGLRTNAAPRRRQAMKILHGLGCWSPRIMYPHPSELVGDWNMEAKATVLAYLNREEFELGEEMGMFDNEFLPPGNMDFLGPTEYTDGVWHWENDLAVYVEQYSVTLPQEFVSHVLRSTLGPADEKIDFGEFKVCHAKWRRWSRNNRSNRLLAKCSYFLF